MTPDPAESRYQEVADAATEFNRSELKKLRFLLRRMRFMERTIAHKGSDGNSIFFEQELESLEFVLTDMGYLAPLPA